MLLLLLFEGALLSGTIHEVFERGIDVEQLKQQQANERADGKHHGNEVGGQPVGIALQHADGVEIVGVEQYSHGYADEAVGHAAEEADGCLIGNEVTPVAPAGGEGLFQGFAQRQGGGDDVFCEREIQRAERQQQDEGEGVFDDFDVLRVV